MTPEEANDLIDAFEAERPEAARLAQLVSLAVRIEPELVRAVRLRLLTEVDAGAEADLWFSPLVQTQSPSLMILVPAVAESLRNRLAKNQELLGRVWDLLREFHRDAPPALRLEEEVTWLALSGNEGRIEERLRSVLAAMKNERRSGLARWATRALPSLPGKARDTEAARILSLVAGVQTGVGPVLPHLPRTGLTQAWLNQAVAKNLGRALIGVRLLKNNVPAGAPSDDGEEGADLVRMWQRAGSLTVEFSYPPVTAAEEVEVPDTYRLLLELSWRDAGGEQTRRVSLVEGETLRVEVGSSEVTMRTVLGDAHTLRPHFEYDFFLAYNRSDEAWAERLVKRLETQPRPAGPLKVLSSTLDHDYLELLPHWSEVAFRESRKVGFVLSHASLTEDLPALELLYIQRPELPQERRWLIPILLQPVELPALMEDLPPVNFDRGRSFEAGFSALWTTITGESLPARQVPLPMGAEQETTAVGLSVIYSHRDAPLYREMLRHLRLLVHEEVITLRGDFDIDAGGDWGREIDSALSESRIVLLLVSPDFLASDYTYDVAIKQAMERHEAGEARVIPVILRRCDGWQNAPFGKLQALPKDARPITDWPDRDQAFADVAAALRRVAQDLISGSSRKAAVYSLIPAPPPFGFVRRVGRDGRDIIERLQEELSPQSRRLVALWGAGGVGKTTLAAEAVRTIAATTGQRVIWVTADGRPNFTFTSLLDDIAAQYERTDLRPLAAGPKEEAVRALLAAAPALVVLDAFETIPPEEEPICLEFLSQRAQCPALIITRQRVEGALLIPLGAMSEVEAGEFLDRLVIQTQDPDIYTEDIRKSILEAAEFNPLVVQWVVGQMDLAQAPEEVLAELSHGEGGAAERVFDRSFNLRQMEDGGRAVLLALSLFNPSGTRPMVGEVAGMKLSKDKDKRRFKKAQQILASLWLIKQTPDGQRLAVADLTRDFAKARLSRDPRAKTFRPRFVARFVRYTEAHEEPTAANLNSIEEEKDNILNALDVAFESGDLRSALRLYSAVFSFLDLRGYWHEAIRRGEQLLAAARNSADERWVAHLTHNLAVFYQKQGALEKARSLYEESLNITKGLGDQSGLAAGLHRLAMVAQDQGDMEEARRLHRESLEIRKSLGDQNGMAEALYEYANIEQAQEKFEEARRLYRESLELNRKLGNQRGISKGLQQLGSLARRTNRYAEARDFYNESLSISRRLGDQQGIADTMSELGRLAVAEGDNTIATQFWRSALEIYEKLGSPAAQSVRALLAELES